jgi:hypothetical protein
MNRCAPPPLGEPVRMVIGFCFSREGPLTGKQTAALIRLDPPRAGSCSSTW